ncbi:hypothetical protein Dimus_022711, partial [Dionaea muscipula]
FGDLRGRRRESWLAAHPYCLLWPAVRRTGGFPALLGEGRARFWVALYDVRLCLARLLFSKEDGCRCRVRGLLGGPEFGIVPCSAWPELGGLLLGVEEASLGWPSLLLPSVWEVSVPAVPDIGLCSAIVGRRRPLLGAAIVDVGTLHAWPWAMLDMGLCPTLRPRRR